MSHPHATWTIEFQRLTISVGSSARQDATWPVLDQMIASRRTAVVSDSFSATLGVLLKGMGNDSNTSGDTFGSELRRGAPPVRAEFDYNPPSDHEDAELDAAIVELNRTLVLFDA